MHVFVPGAKHVKSERRFSWLQVFLALFAVVVAVVPLANGIEQGGDALKLGVITFGFALLGIAVHGLRNWHLHFGRPRLRIMLTPNTVAIKIRSKPAKFYRRGACVGYAPEGRAFYFSDGSHFSLRAFAPLEHGWDEISPFIFQHWWPGLDPEEMKQEMEKSFPITRWTLTLYFGGILAMFALGMVAIIGGIPGMLNRSTVVALVCAIGLLGYDWTKRHQWMLGRERERETVQFDLSAIREEG
jgi:hypothetical protein